MELAPNPHLSGGS